MVFSGKKMETDLTGIKIMHFSAHIYPQREEIVLIHGQW